VHQLNLKLNDFRCCESSCCLLSRQVPLLPFRATMETLEPREDPQQTNLAASSRCPFLRSALSVRIPLFSGQFVDLQLHTTCFRFQVPSSGVLEITTTFSLAMSASSPAKNTTGLTRGTSAANTVWTLLPWKPSKKMTWFCASSSNASEKFPFVQSQQAIHIETAN